MRTAVIMGPIDVIDAIDADGLRRAMPAVLASIHATLDYRPRG